jgi:predicted DNA-binding protein
MATDKEGVRLSLTLSPELNERLEQLAASSHTTKTEILRKAIALYDVVAEAKTEKDQLDFLLASRSLSENKHRKSKPRLTPAQTNSKRVKKSHF